MNYTYLLLLAACFFAVSCSVEHKADLILTSGIIVTMDDEQPEVQAIAIKDGRIVAAGTNQEMSTYRTRRTKVQDLGGAFVTPGFIEGHAHFTGLGAGQLQLDLLGVESWQEIVEMVKEAVSNAEYGELILGRGWHQNDWKNPPERIVGDLPHHDKLSAISPNNPVILRHASGHMRMANAKAMQLAGITSSTADPTGGEIVRDENGEAAGPFRQRAMDFLMELEQSWEPDMEEIVRLASYESLRNGITTFGDAGTPVREIFSLKDVHQKQPLPIRLHLMVRDDNDQMRASLPELAGQIPGDPFFAVSGIKKAIDGALGTHGAWMLEPYEDMPGRSGFNTTPLDEIKEAGELALKHQLQLAVHAIGDRGNREALDLYEALFTAHSLNGNDLRWRIEHTQNLHPRDIPRFNELGVIASMQGIHATSDGSWVAQRIGEQRARRGAYVWRSLLDAGVLIINGTDAPVERLNPIPSFHGSVTRQLPDGSLFFPEQRMSRMETLKSYTSNAAYGIFREEDLGKIKKGYLADFTVWSKNLLQATEDELMDTVPLMTIVHGEIRYRNSEAK
ncbi:MAG: amidohydrolase [Balneolales bacterium]|nr:amidohydrolase [Balneolales bacterium]